MLTAWLKRSLPRSLYGRAALILLVPVVSLQIVVSAAFVQRLYEDVTRQMTRALILELAYLRDVANAAPDIAAAADAAARVGTPLELAIALPAPPAPATDIRRAIDLSGRAMIETLHRDLPEMGPVDLSARREVTLWMPTEWGDMSVTFKPPPCDPLEPASAHRADAGLWRAADLRLLHLSAQSAPPHPQARRSRHRLWQGPRRPLPPLRRDRGARGRGRLPRHAQPDRAPDAGPDLHALRDQPRPAHPPHPPPPRPFPDRRPRGSGPPA